MESANTSSSITVESGNFARETISSIGSNGRMSSIDKYSTILSNQANLRKQYVDSLEFNTLNKLDSFGDSHPVTYTKLIPIVQGVHNSTQLFGFNSASTVLSIDNKSYKVKTESVLPSDCGNNGENNIFENLSDIKVDDDSDCMIVGENQSNIENANEFSNQIINNPIDDLSIEEQIAVDCNQELQIQTSDFYFFKSTSSANEDGVNDAKLDIKPFILSDLSSRTLADTSVGMETDLQEFQIKEEFPDETYYNLNTEIIIKTEETGCNLGGNEIEEKVEGSHVKSTEKFLMDSPVVFSKFCGLPNMLVFNALLQYVEDGMKPLKGVTKFEQLFSILAKLHKNEDNLYLNKYVFPAAYVYTVELLYQKLKLWCNESPDFSSVPEVLMPEFDLRQKIIIVGITTVGIRSNCKDLLKKVKFVKYLIAYTAFGEVFFVSKAFVGAVNTLKLITYCGILKKLKKEHWILFHQDVVLYAVQAKYFFKKWTNNVYCRIASDEIQSYSLQVVNRLCEHFQILKDLIPDFMLYSKNGICFLDRLVFVCCMLLNMLPKVTYM